MNPLVIYTPGLAILAHNDPRDTHGIAGSLAPAPLPTWPLEDDPA